MLLIKVYSNREDFKTVVFNRTGLSFIIAIQKNPGASEKEKANIGKTYNGVGKSLLIRIIHFCLGASKEDYKSFCDKLPGWVFYLDFEEAGKKYTTARATQSPEKITLNDEEFSVTKFNEKMEEMCFDIPNGISTLSYRSLLPFFVRPKKESYIFCNNPGKSMTDYQILLNNSFLLELDVKLVQKKYEIKKEKIRIKKLEENFKSDELLRDFFTGNKKLSLTLVDLDDRIKRLDDDLRNFKVAEDYYHVQVEADRIETELVALRNRDILLKNNIENIEKSLNLTPDMNKESIKSIYTESGIFFSETMTKTLNDLEAFYEKLISNRKRRLLEQQNKLKIEQKEFRSQIEKLGKELDNKMKYLGEHQALDVFVSLNSKNAELKAERENLKRYEMLQTEYKLKEKEIEKNRSEFLEITEIYLNEIKSNIEELRDYFRHLAKIFYPDSISGLTIENNDGDNQLSYKINATIESDASDGINNVKIFCYDLTLLFKGFNHRIDFIFHDSRLFDGIDERQKVEIFKIVSHLFSGVKKQYIATVNQNQLEEIKKHLTEKEFKDIIEQNTVLTLTDESDSAKLLGIKVNIGIK